MVGVVWLDVVGVAGCGVVDVRWFVWLVWSGVVMMYVVLCDMLWGCSSVWYEAIWNSML